MGKDHIPDYEQFPSEFLSDGDIYQIFATNKLMLGRMISGSKSTYYQENPNNLIVFNANIVIETRGKIWHGDLDVTVDFQNLKKVAETLEEPLYVLREMDARFEHENSGFKFWKSRAVIIIPDKDEDQEIPFR